MKLVTTVLLILVTVSIAGCQSSANYKNSSIIEYLYPDSNHQAISAGIPRLTLPLKIGVAFTPGTYDNTLTEAAKQALLERVSASFRTLEFVASIQVVPSTYLRQRGSFDNLDQLKRMFDIDVIALVSYDQTGFTDEGLASIAYWTVVGAYVIKGEKNTTHTMMDAVLYDIASRKLLFRAPGISEVKSRSTIVALPEQQRADSMAGFELASTDLTSNLKAELEAFRVRVKASPAEFQVSNRAGASGTTGAGASGAFILLLISLLCLGKFFHARKS